MINLMENLNVVVIDPWERVFRFVHYESMSKSCTQLSPWSSTNRLTKCYMTPSILTIACFFLESTTIGTFHCNWKRLLSFLKREKDVKKNFTLKQVDLLMSIAHSQKSHVTKINYSVWTQNIYLMTKYSPSTIRKSLKMREENLPSK